MVWERFQRVASARGLHFAEALLMGPAAAGAILALRELHLVSPSPIWLIPLIIVGGQLLTSGSFLWWERSPSRLRLHARIAAQAVVVTAAIYATGWGPALAIGSVLVGQETLAITGSSAQRAVLGWNLSCLAAGQGLIALGWAPSLIPIPAVHGLAVLMGIGVAFSYRSLHTALIEKEDAAALTESHERRFRALVQSSSDLVFVVDATRAVTYASPSCSDVLGYEPEMLLGSEKGVLIHPDEIDELRNTIGRARQSAGGTAEFSFRVRHSDGTWRWLEGIATNLLDDSAVQGVVINARDATERRARTERREAIADLGRDVLRETSLKAVVASATGVINRVMHTGDCRIVWALDGDAEEQQSDTTMELRADDPRHAAGAGARLRVAVGDPEEPLAHIEVCTDGQPTREDEEFIEGVAGTLSSSIVRTRAEDAIRHQATHDPLTGLPNRTLFNDRLEHALARRTRVGGFVAVMVVDLDGFKNVNDSLGHLTGDALLIAVADRFDAHLRDFDTIARLGGDEFAILVDDLDAPDQAGRVAQRVLDALVLPLQLRDRTVAIGASIGIALADRADPKADRLLSHADAAMYRAKREGKGCYRVFEAAMHIAAVERMNLEQALRSALTERALTVHYQPVVGTTTGHLVSFEALARWQHPSRGFVEPDTFIPLAEDAGLIIDLGHAVLLEACRQARDWRERFPQPQPSISVNVSRLQLAHPGFIEHVADALARANLDPSSLTLEVTESVLAGESGRIITALDALRQTGVRVAIDDFGTGYSSFAALAELPIDVLKIDKRFIDNIARNDKGRGFVTAIMHLAQTLHLETIAEGVEHPEQRDALAELGCTYIQGYLFSPPMPGAQTHSYIQHNSAPAPYSKPGRRRVATGEFR
jgi:diguanylate cyclase (GGDEF)-like protein/PAS domain S-box-containing protein